MPYEPEALVVVWFLVQLSNERDGYQGAASALEDPAYLRTGAGRIAHMLEHLGAENEVEARIL